MKTLNLEPTSAIRELNLEEQELITGGLSLRSRSRPVATPFFEPERRGAPTRSGPYHDSNRYSYANLDAS